MYLMQGEGSWMKDSPSQSLRRIHSASLAPITVIARQLQEALGSRLASLVCDLRDPKALPRYASGEQTPRSESEQRLRAVHQILSTLMAGGLSRDGVQAWLSALNPDLDDQCPAELLRTGDLSASRNVLHAARAYSEEYGESPRPDETPANAATVANAD